MAKPAKNAAGKNSNAATVGYEAKLWQMADALRGSMDAAEYKHVVLGLLFLKYISDAFEEQHARLEAEKKKGADPEDPDEYRALNIFWVPPEARWSHLKAQAKQSTIGQLVDDAMAGIERDNSTLKGVLPKDYARPALDKQRLGQLIDLISNIRVGDAESRSKDVLGRVYEYFLSQFASAEGKKGGEFYTPRCVVKLLVEMLEPYKGRVYDPCCGSSGMFVQSEEFIAAHGGKLGDISIYGQVEQLWLKLLSAEPRRIGHAEFADMLETTDWFPSDHQRALGSLLGKGMVRNLDAAKRRRTRFLHLDKGGERLQLTGEMK